MQQAGQWVEVCSKATEHAEGLWGTRQWAGCWREVPVPALDTFNIWLDRVIGHLVQTMLLPSRLDQMTRDALSNLVFCDSVLGVSTGCRAPLP